MEYACAIGRIRENVVRDSDELLQNVAHCTALIPARLDKTKGALRAEGASATGNIGSIGPVELSEEAAIYCDGPTLKKVYTCFSSCF